MGLFVLFVKSATSSYSFIRIQFDVMICNYTIYQKDNCTKHSISHVLFCLNYLIFVSHVRVLPKEKSNLILIYDLYFLSLNVRIITLR